MSSATSSRHDMPPCPRPKAIGPINHGLRHLRPASVTFPPEWVISGMAPPEGDGPAHGTDTQGLRPEEGHDAPFVQVTSNGPGTQSPSSRGGGDVAPFPQLTPNPRNLLQTRS